MCKQLSLFPEEDNEEQQDKKEIDKINLNPLFDRLAQSKFRSWLRRLPSRLGIIRTSSASALAAPSVPSILTPRIRNTFSKKVGRKLRKEQGRRLPNAWHRQSSPMMGSRHRCGTAFSLPSSPSMLQAVVAVAVSRNGMAYQKDGR